MMETAPLRRINTLFLPILLSAALLGCGTLPNVGPSRSDMLAAGARNKVAIVELDPETVQTLANAKPASLVGAFGDYRPARETRIGVGDAVQIVIWEAAAGGLFSSPVVDRNSAGTRSATIPEQVVARDGSITVPFAGRIPVINRTPPEVEIDIVKRLSDKAIDPQALVTITRNISNTVTLMGEGGLGARVGLTPRGDRLLEVLASVGGSRIGPQDVTVVLSRDGRSIRVPLQAVMDDQRENVFLQAGDVIGLVRDPQTFTAMGATGRNSVIPFDTLKLSLDEAVAKGGGLIDFQSDPSGVFVVRYEPASIAAALPQASGVVAENGFVPVIYHVNMRDPASLFLARKFPMRNKDILYVTNAPANELNKVLNLVNLLTTPIVSAAVIRSYAK